MIKKLLMLSLLISGVFSGMHAQTAPACEYRNELKAFETNPRYKDIFDEETNLFLKSIQVDTENYTQLTYWQRFIRSNAMVLDAIIVTPATMPKLHAYVQELCKKAAIEMPAIFIIPNKGFFNAFASKLLASTGSIAIGKKLIDDCTDEELEAVVAHEIGHIVGNHVNKRLALLAASYYATKYCLTGRLGGHFDVGALYLAAGVVVPCIINKSFEKEADMFACQVADRGQGFKGFLQQLQKKEQAQEDCFDSTRAIVQDSKDKMSYADYCELMLRYYLAKGLHNIGNGFKWIYHNTPLGDHPSHEARIEAIDAHMAA